MNMTKRIIGGGLWSAFLYLGIDQTPIFIFAILIAIDFVTWLIASFIVDKTSIKSLRAIQWIFKKSATFMIPFVVALVGKGAGYEDMSAMVTTIISLLIVSEGYSIIANIHAINTKERLPEIDAVGNIIKRILQMFQPKMK